MISREVFFQKVEELMHLYPDAPSREALTIYYETMKSDFSDHQFSQQVEKVKKTSFKFPPIAAFYRDPYESDDMTNDERERIRRVLDRAEGLNGE